MANKGKINRGSEWNKWDLHIHTPYSHTTDYVGATKEEKWENFIEALENLPSEIKVIGINDYLFLDGYKKVLKYKKNGRLQNIDLILPVLEFRLKQFVGNNALNKINYHVIFADQEVLDVEVIETQFLSCFRSSCNLDPDNVDVATWAGVVTKESLIDLGEKIYKATPKGKRGNNNCLKIGFDNISYDLEKLRECLGEIKEPNTYLTSKYIKAIGRAEWEDFRWEGSAKDKKDLINSSHVVFSASPTIKKALEDKDKLAKEKVNNRLIHCSDAHNVKYLGESQNKFDFTATGPKDLGHCFTWIKGDMIFDTLKQVAIDYDNRVLIQERNPDENKASSPELLIDKIEYIGDKDNKKNCIYFSKDINSVIGRRGAGKSVLLKHIAFDIRGESDSPIIKKIEKLKDFKLVWCDNSSDEKYIEYIPQNYISSITYEDGDKFEERDELLREKLFNDDSFKNADEHKKEIINSIEIGIHSRVKEIINLQEQILSTTTQLKPLGKSEDKENSIQIRREKIASLGKIEITEEDIANQTEYSSTIKTLTTEIEQLQQDMKIIQNVSGKDILSINSDAFVGLSEITFNLVAEQITKLSVDDMRNYFNELIMQLNDKATSRIKKKEDLKSKLEPINKKLQVNKTLETILSEISTLNEEKKEIEKLDERRKKLTGRKESIIKEIVDLYLSYKEGIEGVVKSLENKFDKFSFITFNFVVGYNLNLYEKKFYQVYVDGRSGERFRKPIDEKRDFEKEELCKIVEDIIDNSEDAKLRVIGNDKENALLVLLECRYDIDFTKSVKYKDNGVLVDFENMTGGQKSMALLDLFFNLSKSRYPIVIDQPENDIDVSGISNDLRKLILDQKERRQIIMATHSPNLVLLTDSENVIVAENENGSIRYHNGGIESQQIQEDIVNILDGGREALEKRMKKLNLKD